MNTPQSYYVWGDENKVVIDSDVTTVIYFKTTDEPLRDTIVSTFVDRYNVREGVALDVAYRIDQYYMTQNKVPFELEINGFLSDQ